MNDVHNVIVLDLDVMQSAHPADDIVGHGNDAHLQTPADLHIRLGGPQEQHIGGKAPDNQ